MLRKELGNALEMSGMSKSDLAYRINVSNGTVTNFFKGEEVFLDTLINMVRELTPEKEDVLVFEYIKNISKHKSIRIALEYVSTRRVIELFDVVVDKAINSGNAQTQNKGKLYQIIFHWQTNNPRNLEVDTLDSIQELNSKHSEDLFIKKMFDVYYHYYNSDFGFCYSLLPRVEKIVEKIENSFIKRMSKGRIEEIRCFIELRLNCDKAKARSSADTLIQCNLGNSYTASAYYTKGLSYIFEDINVCINNFKEAIKFFKKANQISNVASTKKQINFAENYWGKSKTKDQFYDIIFNHIRNDRPDEVRKIIGEDNPKYLFLIGLAEKSHNILMHSLIGYTEEGDAFLAQLPEKSIKENFDVDDLLIERIKNIKKAS